MRIIEFIKRHENWEELLTADPYNIKISRDDNYILFKYNQLSSDFLLPEVRESRGLILNDKFEIVCHPFDKFGNYGEEYCPQINWSKASVQQKVDGSLMKVWFADRKWHVSTNGTIDAFKAELGSIKYDNFGDLFIAALPVSFDDFTEMLDQRFTYMFELVSPHNRIVIPYETTELYFLGLRNNFTQDEFLPETSGLCKLFKVPTRYQLKSLEDVQMAAAALPWDEEGYVVCDDKFNRVKIKSPEYVKAHFARNNSVITYEHLLEVILTGEKTEFLTYAADYADDLEKVENAYNQTLEDIRVEVAKLKPETFSSRKELAFYINDTKPAWLRPFLFKYDRVEDTIKNVRLAKWIEILEVRGDLDA